MNRPVSRSAFTMLELLVVIVIMAVLASMILVGAKAIIGNAEQKKTETIVQTVRTGIELAIANKGNAISPVEHPFAGSRANAGAERFKFVRMTPPTSSGWTTTVSRSGTALKGVPTPKYLKSDQEKLMMADDLYADERVVLLFGARREHIGVLQSQRKVVTQYRLLPMPPKLANGDQPVVLSPRDGASNHPYDNTWFPDTMIPSDMPAGSSQEDDNTYGRLSDTKPALDYLFGNSNAQGELASLKALYNADPALPEEVNKFRTLVESRTVKGITEPLVYSDYTSSGAGAQNKQSRWKPGHIPVSGSTNLTLDTATGDTWVRYRLPGLAVYDAWGNELMTVTGANSAYRVISAGLDGALAVDPGANKSIETTLTGEMREKLPIHEKDEDGAKDNLQ